MLTGMPIYVQQHEGVWAACGQSWQSLPGRHALLRTANYKARVQTNRSGVLEELVLVVHVGMRIRICVQRG